MLSTPLLPPLCASGLGNWRRWTRSTSSRAASALSGGLPDPFRADHISAIFPQVTGSETGPAAPLEGFHERYLEKAFPDLRASVAVCRAVLRGHIPGPRRRTKIIFPYS